MNALFVATDVYFALRDRVLSNPRFQRFAADFPLTRGIARRRATALFDLCAGFVYSQVLRASVELGLLEALEHGPKTADAIALDIGLSLEATQRLLYAAVSLRLVERRGLGRYGLGVHGLSYVGNPAVARMVAHHTLFYRDLADPVALLRGATHDTELRRFWSYGGSRAGAEAHEAEAYSALMAESLSLIAEDILEAYPLTGHRRLLDVGGGEGAFLEAAAGQAKHLDLLLFDLPPVARLAEARLERAGLADRARVTGGDVFRDPLPDGADVISLVRVIHDHDDPQALAILRAARRALSRGVLLVAEPMAQTSGAEPMGDAYFGFYLLAMGQGRPRTPSELCALLHQAGFDHAELRKTRRPMLTRLIVAHAG